MKIAIVSLYPERGAKHVNISGVASYTKNLLKNIPLAPGDQITVVCNKTDGQTEEYTEDGFTVLRTFDRNAKFVGQIYRQIKQLQPDAVHIQQEIPLYGGIHTAFMLPWLLFLLRRWRTAITLHHVVSLQKVDKAFVRSNKSSMPVWAVKLAFGIITKSLVRWAHAVIVHEDYFRNILISEYGADSNKIMVIPHGVEDFTASEQQAARKKIGLDTNRHAVLFMGYLAGYKGIDLLLEGFGEYAKTDPLATLIIGAGKHPKFQNDPAYLKEYADKQDKAAALIPAGQFKWIGFIPEDKIGDYYSACDVTLYPYTISMSSSGPMSFAMGYQKPFLASDVFADVLPPEVLFKRDPAGLAEKLSYFFAHQSDFTAFSAKLKAERLWSKVGVATKKVYEGPRIP